jgi:NADPH-dependent 2,4-dienoyl-CoA reductase/sulfur reductase-like enzyme
MRYPYVIVGGGLAGASAIEGIRAHDKKGAILLVSRENHPPYNRPPLSKDLWVGKTTLDKIPVYDEAFYGDNQVELTLRREIVEIDAVGRQLWDDRGVVIEYEKLLLATGGWPRRLDIEGAELEGVHYYRYLEDYLSLRQKMEHVQHVLILGGGFIGMELASALRQTGKEITLLYREEYPLGRVLPRDLGLFVADYYRKKGVETVSGEKAARITLGQGTITVMTQQGNQVTTQLVLVGAGIEPQTDLAEAAGLDVGNGIVVDEYACTSNPHIWAAGDVAEFPELLLDKRTRIEHWDHAIQHGKAAGANMAGANRPYTHLPFFYSDLFDLGWEAVGEIDGSMVTHAVWKEEFRTGVVFYLRDDVVRGALLWNVWEKVEWARGLIREARTMSGSEREALVHAFE